MLDRRKLLKSAALVAALAPLGFSGTALAQQNDLNWFVNSDLSGPAAYSSAAEAEGIQDFVAWKNAQGGIRGRKINVTVADTGFQPSVSVANFNKAVAGGHLDYVYADSTGMVQGVTPENNATYKIYMGGGSQASELADPSKYPYYFINGVTYGQQMVALVRYIDQTRTGSEKPKLAIVHSSAAFGRDGLELAQAEAAKLGIDVVLIQQTKMTESDVSAFALAVRQAAPTHVIFHGYAMGVWPEVMRLVRDYGMDDVVFMGTVWQNEREKVIELGEVADGLIGVAMYNTKTQDAQGEMMKVIDEIQRKKNASYSGYVTIGYLDGWLDAMMAAVATEKVIDEGKEINGDNLVAALNGLKDWDTGGIIESPVTFKNNAIGLARIFKWDMAKDWSPEPVSEWMYVE